MQTNGFVVLFHVNDNTISHMLIFSENHNTYNFDEEALCGSDKSIEPAQKLNILARYIPKYNYVPNSPPPYKLDNFF